MAPRFHVAALAAAFAFFAAPLCALGQEPTPAPKVPVARIISPIPDQQVRGAAVIQGSAVAPGFLRYEIAYAVAAADPVWIPIGGSQTPVANGTLLTWNTRALADGDYILRLQVISTEGSFFATVTSLKLTNAAATTAATPVSSATTSQRSGPASEIDTARDALSAITDATARIPDAFLRGMRLAGMALGALVAYAIAKSLLLWLLRRAFRRPIDYGA